MNVLTEQLPAVAGMVATPNSYCLVKGAGEAGMPLNAFDKALLDAGIGDTNLVRMSSIVPPSCERTAAFRLPAGGLIPVAYASYESQKPGETIAAAIAAGIPEDPSLPGVIMEYEAARPLEEVEQTVRQMVAEAFDYRHRALKEIHCTGIQHVVERCGAVFAGAVLWYK